MNLLNELAIGKIIEFEDGTQRTIIKKLPHQDIKGAYYYEFNDGLCERDIRIHGKIVSNLVEPLVIPKIADVEEKYNELIMAVAKKFTNETRHQTALRYIQESEKLEDNTPCKNESNFTV